ncbi:MAG TPA: hypothetical protein EYQ50_09655 [Verrucomicrobiales bacterium]|nr:hypothetical protein [Verrucomicrobiales bacterium]HIL72269.1 hypothetical protein [Verrucomicrobiota bacterium]
MENKKQVETIAFSFIGVIVMFVILFGFNIVSSALKVRIDLTEENLYTLTQGTKEILKELDTPVTMRFYYSRSSNDIDPQLKNFARRIEDLLTEYREYSNGHIELVKVDPKPDTDEEDAANLDGIQGIQGRTGDMFYLGISISCLDAKVSIPFLSPQKENLLEYDLSRAVSRVFQPKRPKLGIMSSLPVSGSGPVNPMMMQMGQMPPQVPAWAFYDELKKDFDVQDVEMTATEIPSDIDVLFVIHPKAISDKSQFAIDQFILKGGKMIAFLDPYSFMDAQQSSAGNPMNRFSQQTDSNLPKLLEAWGIKFDTQKVLADLSFATTIGRNNQKSPAILSLNEKGINRDDVSTSDLDNLIMAFAGTFSGDPTGGLEKTVLLESTEDSQLVDAFMVKADISASQVTKDFNASDKKQALAIRLQGKFKTAFPEGSPEDPADESADGEEESGPKPAPNHLTEAESEGAVVLIADSDMLHDQFCIRRLPIFGQQLISPISDNLNLAQNFSEQMSGDVNLIGIRGRSTMRRPFEVINQKRVVAEESYRTKIKDLEQELQDANTELNQLQSMKQEEGQKVILSEEQRKTIENFTKKRSDTRKVLRQVRKDLRGDISSLENRLKWINIAGMPFLVVVSGISLAIVKRKKVLSK